MPKKLKVIFEEIRTNRTKISLDLSHREIGDRDTERLTKALKSNTSLTSIDLSYNQINEVGARALLAMLESSESIIDLNLTGNNITEQLIVEFNQLLKTRQKFTGLIKQKRPTTQQETKENNDQDIQIISRPFQLELLNFDNPSLLTISFENIDCSIQKLELIVELLNRDKLHKLSLVNCLFVFYNDSLQKSEFNFRTTFLYRSLREPHNNLCELIFRKNKFKFFTSKEITKTGYYSQSHTNSGYSDLNEYYSETNLVPGYDCPNYATLEAALGYSNQPRERTFTSYVIKKYVKKIKIPKKWLEDIVKLNTKLSVLSITKNSNQYNSIQQNLVKCIEKEKRRCKRITQQILKSAPRQQKLRALKVQKEAQKRKISLARWRIEKLMTHINSPSNPTNIKIALLGSGGPGLSALVVRFVTDHFIQSYDPTIEENYRKEIELDGGRYLLDILDTSTNEVYRDIQFRYPRGSISKMEVAIICFSLACRGTFLDLTRLIYSWRRCKDSEAPFILVGTHADINDEERQISSGEINDYIQAYQPLAYFESSAKTRQNVDTIFHVAAKYHDSEVLLVDQFRNTLLHAAVLCHNIKAVRAILDLDEIDVNIINEDGETALDLAYKISKSRWIVRKKIIKLLENYISSQNQSELISQEIEEKSLEEARIQTNETSDTSELSISSETSEEMDEILQREIQKIQEDTIQNPQEHLNEAVLSDISIESSEISIEQQSNFSQSSVAPTETSSDQELSEITINWQTPLRQNFNGAEESSEFVESYQLSEEFDQLKEVFAILRSNPNPFQVNITPLQQKWLAERSEEEQRMGAQINYIKGVPNLLAFYDRFCLKLNELFTGCKAISGGASAGFGKAGSILLTIRLAGSILELTPLVIFTKTTRIFLKRRKKKRGVNLSKALGSSPFEFDKVVRNVGMKLVKIYEPQIRMLLDSENSEKLADCAVGRIYEAIKAKARKRKEKQASLENQRGEEAREIAEEFKLTENSMLKMIMLYAQKEGFLRRQKKLKTNAEISEVWNDRGVFQGTGIHVLNRRKKARFYESTINYCHEVALYGYRQGTPDLIKLMKKEGISLRVKKKAQTNAVHDHFIKQGEKMPETGRFLEDLTRETEQSLAKQTEVIMPKVSETSRPTNPPDIIISESSIQILSKLESSLSPKEEIASKTEFEKLRDQVKLLEKRDREHTREIQRLKEQLEESGSDIGIGTQSQLLVKRTALSENPYALNHQAMKPVILEKRMQVIERRLRIVEEIADIDNSDGDEPNPEETIKVRRNFFEID